MTPNQRESQMHSRMPENQCAHGFLCKHDGCHKARLVAGGHLTPDLTDNIYSGVVSTRFL